MDSLYLEKQTAKSKIDTLAYNKRKTNNTVGMDDIYREKAEQAVEYAVAGYPYDLSLFPFIEAEVEATGLTPQEAAEIIMLARQKWMFFVTNIEKERRKGKINIEKATTIRDVEIARDNAIEALQKV